MLFRLLLYTIFSTLDKLLFLKALTGGATTQRSDIGKGRLWRWESVISNEMKEGMPAFAGITENGGCRLRGTHTLQKILLYGFYLETLAVAV